MVPSDWYITYWRARQNRLLPAPRYPLTDAFCRKRRDGPHLA
jgi:hypothetical protein